MNSLAPAAAKAAKQGWRLRSGALSPGEPAAAAATAVIAAEGNKLAQFCVVARARPLI